MSETWTDDDRFSLVEELRAAQREFYSYKNPADRPPSLFPRCRSLEARVDAMLAARRKPEPTLNLFGEPM